MLVPPHIWWKKEVTSSDTYTYTVYKPVFLKMETISFKVRWIAGLFDRFLVKTAMLIWLGIKANEKWTH